MQTPMQIWRGSSGDRYLARLLRSFRYRYRNLQNPVLQFRLHLVGLRTVGQRNGAEEAAIIALPPMIAFVVFLVLLFPLA